jgi:hypothetical protein
MRRMQIHAKVHSSTRCQCTSHVVLSHACGFAGPVTPPEGPAEPAPGSAVWVKEGTRPGGAAAAAPAGSADDDVVQGKDSSSKEAPDLSKMLPEKRIAGAH